MISIIPCCLIKLVLAKDIQYVLKILKTFETKSSSSSSMRALCNFFEIEKFALAVFHGEDLKNFDLHHTYPHEWIKMYREEGYQFHDPVFKNLKDLSLPFTWNKSFFSFNDPMQKKLYDNAKLFNIFSGTTIPLIPYKKAHGFLTIINDTNLHPEVLYTISIAANFYVKRFYVET